jgi:Proteasome assembly chaperone 4
MHNGYTLNNVLGSMQLLSCSSAFRTHLPDLSLNRNMCLSTGFVSMYMLGNTEVETLGVICSGLKDSVENTLGQRSFTDHSCFILRLVQHPDTIYILCNYEVQQEHTFAWADQVGVIIFISLH